MTPEQLAACLNLVASRIDSSETPSRTAVASDIRAIVAMMDSDGAHFAGFWSDLFQGAKKNWKGLKRKLGLKGEGQKSLILQKKGTDKVINSTAPKVKKLILNFTEPLEDIFDNDSHAHVFVQAMMLENAIQHGKTNLDALHIAIKNLDGDNPDLNAARSAVVLYDKAMNKNVKNQGLRSAHRKVLATIIDNYIKVMAEESKGVDSILKEYDESKKPEKTSTPGHALPSRTTEEGQS